MFFMFKTRFSIFAAYVLHALFHLQKESGDFCPLLAWCAEKSKPGLAESGCVPNAKPHSRNALCIKKMHFEDIAGKAGGAIMIGTMGAKAGDVALRRASPRIAKFPGSKWATATPKASVFGPFVGQDEVQAVK